MQIELVDYFMGKWAACIKDSPHWGTAALSLYQRSLFVTQYPDMEYYESKTKQLIMLGFHVGEPNDLKYVQQIRSVLKTLGAWKLKRTGYGERYQVCYNPHGIGDDVAIAEMYDSVSHHLGTVDNSPVLFHP